MGNHGRNRKIGITLTGIALIALLVVLTPTVYAASTVPKPSLPEFTVNIIDKSHDVAPTTSVDPYTGEAITIPGRHVQAYDIEVSIKNQPYAYSSNNITYSLSYNVRSKGHFEEGWNELYQAPSGEYFHYPSQSNSEYTNISVSTQYPLKAQIDFQVIAFVSHSEIELHPLHPMLGPEYGVEERKVYIIDETSGWSQTQNVTIPDGTQAAQQSNVLAEVLFGFDWQQVAIVLFVVVVVLAAALVVLAKKNRKRVNENIN